MKPSVVIIAKNEEDRIGRTISSVLSLTDDIIVIDTGSNDETVNVSLELGASVFSEPWNGYGETKNRGTIKAKYNWIFSLDADEVPSKELISQIKSLPEKKGKVYMINRIVNYKSKWIEFSGWHPDWVARLYHRDECKWDERLVHEKLIIDKAHKNKLSGLLYHYSFRSENHFMEKIDHYARLSAEQWIEKDKKPSIFKRWFGPSWKFLEVYYLNKGYKDGVHGKEIASILSDGVRKKIYYFDKLKKGST